MRTVLKRCFMKEEGDPYEYCITLCGGITAHYRRGSRPDGTRSGVYSTRASAEWGRFCARVDLWLVARTRDHAGWLDAGAATAGSQYHGFRADAAVHARGGPGAATRLGAAGCRTAGGRASGECLAE